ncbi:glycosyltransferase [Roseibium salinum]|nr:glycosyltransferase [Roseibium salinum]
MEAALVGSALVTGPRVSNARAIYKEFWNGGAALRVPDPVDLAEHVAGLLRDPRKARDQAAKARAMVEAGRGALEKNAVPAAALSAAGWCRANAGGPT